MKVELNNTVYNVTLPDREGIKKIKYRVRLFEAEKNPYPDTDPKKNADYAEGMDDIHYWIASEMCGVENPDPVIVEAIGREIKFYLLQGPPRSRIPTMEELERMTGQLMLASGDKTAKTQEIWELVERIRQVISVQKPEKEDIAEADVNGDPTPKPA